MASPVRAVASTERTPLIQSPDVIVIGAGAAGIFAAWRAATLGANVWLLEKTPRIGTKVLISGGGKCNLTHAGTVDEVLRAFRKPEALFLRPSVYRFKNQDVMDLVSERGLALMTRPDGRVFPDGGTAKQVAAVLETLLEEAGVRFVCNAPVTKITRAAGLFSVHMGQPKPSPKTLNPASSGFGARALLNEVLTHSPGSEAQGELPSIIQAKTVILATGGSSYPVSGTTGDGYRWVQSLGHTVEKIRAALAPIYLIKPLPEHSGVALRDCVLRARFEGKEVDRWKGDVLFTHHGISGPCALGISRVVTEKLEHGEVRLEVDLYPEISFEKLVEQLTAYVAKLPRKLARSFFSDRVPSSLEALVMENATFERDLPAGRLDKKARNRLVSTLKGWDLGSVATVPLEKGEVVAGGVSLDEVDPKSMASRKAPGLFLCGEVLDIAGPVGGYNLQAAFSTGYVAGESAFHASRP